MSLFGCASSACGELLGLCFASGFWPISNGGECGGEVGAMQRWPSFAALDWLHGAGPKAVIGSPGGGTASMTGIEGTSVIQRAGGCLLRQLKVGSQLFEQTNSLTLSTRRGCLAMALVAGIPVAASGRFRPCNRVLPSKLPKGLRTRSVKSLRHRGSSRVCRIC